MQFGHGLQQLLTTVPYSEVAGQRNVEWDALQVCARVMTMFLRNPEILKSLSGHVDSGDVIPDALLDKAFKGGFMMYHQKKVKEKKKLKYFLVFLLHWYYSYYTWMT